MRRFFCLSCGAAVLTVGLAGPAQAGKGKAQAAAPAAAKSAAPSARSLEELGGIFKFGQTIQESYEVLEKELRERLFEEAGKPKDPLRQDRVREDTKRELERIKATQADFRGQATPWNVSIIDKEFGHNNEETLIVLQEKGQQRYLFFYQGRLYKQFVAFDADMFAGKTFAQFADIVQGRYGAAMPRHGTNRNGQKVLAYLEWPAAGNLRLRAIDQAEFYHTYCLALDDVRIAQLVDPKHTAKKGEDTGGNDLIETVKERGQHASAQDENVDVVDKITGRKRRGREQSIGENRSGPTEGVSEGDVKVVVPKKGAKTVGDDVLPDAGGDAPKKRKKKR